VSAEREICRSPVASVGEAGPLPRTLNTWSAAAILVGSTIGSGIFRVPSTVAAEVGSLSALAGLWIAGAVVTLFGVLTMAELASMFPRSGGIYVYLREAYGPLAAFLFGWTRLLVIQPAVLGGVAIIFATYAGGLVGVGEVAIRWIAAATIAFLAAANYRSVTWVAAAQTVVTATKVLVLAGLATAAMVAGNLFGLTSAASPADPAWVPAATLGLGPAFIAVLWTYDGWADLTYVSGEVRDPGRSLPVALIGGVALVALVYLAVNVAYLALLPIAEIAAAPNVAAVAATRALGGAGARVAAALVMLCTFGSLVVMTMTGPRIFFAMAQDGLFFRRMGAVHPRYQTPYAAITLAALLGIGYVSLRTFEQLAEAFILGIWPFYMLAAAGVMRLRRHKPDLPRPYRTLGYPAVPLVFFVAALVMLANALVTRPGPALFGFGVIASGVPVYLVWRRTERRAAPTTVAETSRSRGQEAE
jgi:basic amino acid/polyamine antiporter, APA family